MTPALLLQIVAASASLLDPASLVMRSGATPPDGEVKEVSIEGVVLQPSDGSKPVVIGWDRIVKVEGTLAQKAEPFRALADGAWRGVSRAARGDYIGAEPLLEPLFEQTSWRKGPTPAAISQALMQCRLSRGANLAAIGPWLSLLASESAPTPGPDQSPATVQQLGASMVPDPSTGLVPFLPPVFLDSGASRTLEKLIPMPDPAASPARVVTLAALYLDAIRLEAHEPVELPARPSLDEGVCLVWDMVAARSPDAETRRHAREALEARLGGSPAPWQEAWIRASLGRSLLMEDDDQRLLGIAQLLNLPARLRFASPWLTGIAMAESAASLAAHDDLAGAQRLKADLSSFLPGHPAAEWEPFRAIPAPAPRTPGTPAPDPPKDPPKDGGPP